MRTRTLLLCLLCFVGWSQSQLSPKSPPVSKKDSTQTAYEKQKASNHEQSTQRNAMPTQNQVGPFVENKKTTANTDEDLKINRRLSLFTGQLAGFTWWLACFTAGLVVVGGLQLGALFWQAKVLSHHSELIGESVEQMRQAVGAYQQFAEASQGMLALTRESNATTVRATELTRQSFILSNRPRLIIRNVSVCDVDAMFHPEPTEPVGGAFFIANIGTSTSRIISVDCGIYRADTLPMVPPFTSDGQNPDRLLPPGKGTKWSFETLLTGVQIGELSGIIDHTANVYVIGRIGYTDDLGTMRSTAFCRKWDNSRGRFLAVDDPDYEHTE